MNKKWLLRMLIPTLFISNAWGEVKTMKVVNRPSFRKIESNLAALDQFIQDAMAKTGTVGLSIAIIENGKIVQSKGYGVIGVNSQQKVTPETLMMIGAATIPLTAALLATFVDENKVKWNDRVVDFYPNFKLSDKALTEEITFEQMINGASFVARRDIPFVVNYSGETAQDLFQELANMPLTDNQYFHYQNHTPAALGYILGQMAYPQLGHHDAYMKLMQERLFIPLNMQRTTFNFKLAVVDQNHAEPHWLDTNGNPIAMDKRFNHTLDYVAPTGAAWSTVIDLAKYLITELKNGVNGDGTRIIGEANTRYRRHQQVKLDADTDDFYGLGWVVKHEAGTQWIEHTGNAFGYSTHLAFDPRHHIGVVMLANNFHDYLIAAAIQKKLSQLWFNSNESAEHYLDEEVKARKKISQMYHQTPDLALLSQFIGVFKNKDIGEWKIAKVKDDFIMTYGKWQSRLSTYKKPEGNTILIGLDPILTWINFEMVPNDNNDAFEVRLRKEKYVFKRLT